jgi:hypothetical protein
MTTVEQLRRVCKLLKTLENEFKISNNNVVVITVEKSTVDSANVMLQVLGVSVDQLDIGVYEFSKKSEVELQPTIVQQEDLNDYLERFDKVIQINYCTVGKLENRLSEKCVVFSTVINDEYYRTQAIPLNFFNNL